ESQKNSRISDLLKSSIKAHAQEPAATLSLSQEVSLAPVLGRIDSLWQQRYLGLFSAGVAARCRQSETGRCSSHVLCLFPSSAWYCHYKGRLPVSDALDRDWRFPRG